MANRVVPDRYGVINIGKLKENLVTEVSLPAPGFAGGSYAVLLRRPKEEQPYPVTARHDGSNLVWTVQTADTAIAGMGKLECRWYGDNGEVAKSQIYTVRITDGLPDPTEAPEAWAGFMQQVSQDAGRAESAADNAAKTLQKLEDGIASGDFRGEKGEKGEKGDPGPQGPQGEAGPAGDTTAADAAAAAAKQAAQEAQKAAEASAGSAAQAAESVGGLADDLKATRKDVAKMKRAIQFQAQLNQGQTWDFEVDTQTAYQRIVPSGAKAGAILEVSGKTRRGRNLWDMSAPLTEGNANIVNGHYVATSSILLIDCNWESIGTRRISIPAGDITISFDSDINGNVFLRVVYQDDAKENFFLQGNPTTVALQKQVKRCGFTFYDAKVGAIVKNVQVELGTTAHPYEPYTPDLVSAEVDEVRVRGRNLLDTTKLRSTVANNGVTYTRNDDGTYNRVGVASTDATNIWLWGNVMLVPNLQSPNWIMILKKGITYYIHDIRLYTVIGGKAIGHDGILVPDKDLYITGIRNSTLKSGTTYDDIVYPGIYESQKKVAWSQYHLSTHPIPADIRNLPGYGWSAGSVANTVERTENGWQYVQRVGSRAYQEGDELTDGTTTYYALESPITTDITALMGDSLAPFAVEAGGSITLHHPKADEGFAIDVPAKIQYIIKLSEVSANG